MLEQLHNYAGLDAAYLSGKTQNTLENTLVIVGKQKVEP